MPLCAIEIVLQVLIILFKSEKNNARIVIVLEKKCISVLKKMLSKQRLTVDEWNQLSNIYVEYEIRLRNHETIEEQEVRILRAVVKRLGCDISKEVRDIFFMYYGQDGIPYNDKTKGRLQSEQKKRLHEELHALKNKIEINKINNKDYKKEEKRCDEILSSLEYNNKDISRDSYCNEKAYKSFRVVPNKNGISKIYHG